jgi:catechol 2,3-dioxygenase-like lactoylglutathione lyase family enzyme
MNTYANEAKMKLDNIRLLVKNFAECYNFYRDIIGLKPAYGNEHEAYASFVTEEGFSIGLFKQELQYMAMDITLEVNKQDNQHAILVFEVQDVRKKVEELKKIKVPIIHDVVDMPAWGLTTAHIADPDGNIIEVFTAIK